MYHRAGIGKRSNLPEMLDQHFEYLLRYPISLPGQPLQKGVNICLTFDDATVDFADTIYPLLQKHQLPAVLGVPTALINTPGYCSWSDLSSFKNIHFASHSHTHRDLTAINDPQRELIVSKDILESKLSQPITTCIYPYGRYSKQVLKETKEHYTYAMRIGDAYNFSWDDKLLYRVSADNLSAPSAPFRKTFLRYGKTLFKKARHL